MTVLLCPLCSQPCFSNLESLRVSLVNVATQNISCPICDDILIGLDKLTIHLFGHTLNQNDETGQRPSLKLKQTSPIVDSYTTSKPENQVQCQDFTTEKSVNHEEGVVLTNTDKTFSKYEEKFFNQMDPSYSADESPKLFPEEPSVRSDNLCTVNMEDLSFLTSWESNIRQKQDQKESKDQEKPLCNDKDDSSDLSEYMSDLLNKKLPMSNFSLTQDNTDKSKTLEKEQETEENRQKCKICGFVFPNAVILSMHEELLHSKKTTCRNNSVDSDQSIHCEAEIPVPNHSSEEKNEFFMELLDNNQTNDDKPNDANPGESDITLKTAEENKKAKDELAETKLPRYHCHLCSKYFKMKGSLLLHFRVAHFGFSSSQSLKILSDSPSSGEKIHPCTICSKSFKKEQHLTQHIKTHEGKQWQCNTCNKHFTTKYFLKKHQRLHTGEMPYSCLTCKKTFTFQQSYHKHLLYHSDEKPHQCAQCGRSFKELSTLHNHQRIHSGEKPFACETCGKCFRQRVSYIVHQRIHTGVLPYQCTACEKKFRYKVSQRSHKCTAQPPGIVIRQPDIVQKILENKNILHQNPTQDFLLN